MKKTLCIRNLYIWKLFGFIFTGLTGILLHFMYDWTGQSAIAALFSAVNESTWEHMKLIFFPMLAFTAIEYHCLSPKYENYWSSKLFGILYGLTLIPVLYYLVIGILGSSPGWFNILIFFMAAAGAYWLEIQILKEERAKGLPSWAAITILLLIALLFMLFTFFPPQIPLFEDPSLPGPSQGMYDKCL